MLEGLTPNKKQQNCALHKLIETLDKTDRDILEQAVANVALWTSNSLSNALRDRGIVIADHTITKHRNKVCVCYKS